MWWAVIFAVALTIIISVLLWGVDDTDAFSQKDAHDVVGSREAMIALATQYAPVYYLHSYERFFPVDLGEILTQCHLYHGTIEGDKTLVLNSHDVTVAHLLGQETAWSGSTYATEAAKLRGTIKNVGGTNYRVILSYITNFWLSYDETRQSLNGLLSNADITPLPSTGVSVSGITNNLQITPKQYVRVRLTTVAGQNYIDLIYNTFYPYNGSISLIPGYDEHFLDSETFGVRLDATTQQPVRYYFGQHEGGVWIQPQHMTFHNTTHPIAYVARESHELYPDAGRHARLYGIADDITDTGFLWTPGLTYMDTFRNAATLKEMAAPWPAQPYLTGIAPADDSYFSEAMYTPLWVVNQKKRSANEPWTNQNSRLMVIYRPLALMEGVVVDGTTLYAAYHTGSQRIPTEWVAPYLGDAALTDNPAVRATIGFEVVFEGTDAANIPLATDDGFLRWDKGIGDYIFKNEDRFALPGLLKAMNSISTYTTEGLTFSGLDQNTFVNKPVSESPTTLTVTLQNTQLKVNGTLIGVTVTNMQIQLKITFVLTMSIPVTVPANVTQWFVRDTSHWNWGSPNTTAAQNVVDLSVADIATTVTFVTNGGLSGNSIDAMEDLIKRVIPLFLNTILPHELSQLKDGRVDFGQ